ncbi:MAG: SDR family oxidoreductase [Betaproteobacteria bacterium]|nr:SDR family oxidoreductase [Betaproteobacteria bacterium]
MPSIQTPLGSLPARFRRPRVLIAGCGDVGQRAAKLLKTARVMALTSSPDKRLALRALGVVPLSGNLDDATSLSRLSGLATHVLHLAPPLASRGVIDLRTQAFLRALRRRAAPQALVYGSTSGVYGDCGGALVNERQPTRPQTARAVLRVDAEKLVNSFGRATGVRTCVLRIPGIYAPDRDGGTPKARLERGTPVLTSSDDVYTNHIHADDLARACVIALWRCKARRTYNVNDNTQLKMGDYFDLAADLYGLPRPPRVSRAEAADQLAPITLSFMSESRRMDNGRLKLDLRLQLRYPTVAQGLIERI